MARPTYKRTERVADQIRMEVADILTRKTKDPRLALVTVTDVEMSEDLRSARVYISTLQEGTRLQEVLQGLRHAVGFIRAELGRRVTLRHTPELIFQPDVRGRQAEHLWRLLDRLAAAREGKSLSTETAIWRSRPEKDLATGQ
ncbi:MAG: 30S ribosome-binding factor RbfA [Nitrospirae bacterium]|nr:MAG: 30S ribosome-binding factor RbfA [Nitrospirota bacterium]